MFQLLMSQVSEVSAFYSRIKVTLAYSLTISLRYFFFLKTKRGSTLNQMSRIVELVKILFSLENDCNFRDV